MTFNTKTLILTVMLAVGAASGVVIAAQSAAPAPSDILVPTTSR